MFDDLKGKSVLVTGSSTGIGAAVAKAFAAAGAKVAVHGNSSKAEAEKVLADIEAAGGEAILVMGDVMQTEVIGRVIQETADAFGGLMRLYERRIIGIGIQMGLSREDALDACQDAFLRSRDALAKGNMKKVSSLIGRSFSLQGRVTKGAGRGSGLGFPTANLEIDPEHILPADGVYATHIYIDGKSYPSVTNIGKNPTFGENKRTVETYVINYSGNLYERELKIDFIERLRGEKRFESVEDLIRQMTADVQQGKIILETPAASNLMEVWKWRP